MNVKSSILNKVFKNALLISLISIIAINLIFGVSIAFLRQNTINVSKELGDSAAQDSKKALESQTLQSLRSLARAKADLSDEKLQSVQTYVQMLSENATNIMSNPTDYTPFPISPPDPSNKGIYIPQLLHGDNLTYADIKEEADLLGNNAKLLLNFAKNDTDVTAAYIGSENGTLICVDKDSDLKTELFEPRARGWYKLAKQNDSLSWTDVFDDQLGRGLAITCAAPYYDSQKKFCGVIGIGSLLTNLNEIVVGTKIGETGYAFVLNGAGQMIISPTIEKDNDGKIIRENLLESNNEDLKLVAEKMVERESGIVTVTIDGVEYYMAYEPFNTLPWSMATIISVEEALMPATASEKNIISLRDDALDDIDFAIVILAVTVVAVFILIVISVMYFSRKTASRLTKPIIELTNSASIIGKGDFSKKLTADTGDEIESLAGAFNKMIDNIQLITADKERIATELNVAKNIQASMLPCIFPPFPEMEHFDIFASMHPAKEVGGDFYDFFLIDSDHLGVVIADVSGKSVPAALFMVIAKTLIKNHAQSGKSPSEVFMAVNEQLCENNEMGMFVTAFLGVLEISTGEFTFVNAGHNPPVIKKSGSAYEYLKVKPGFVLAGIEGMKYREESTKLKCGDILYLYTDGVTEAVNQGDELFGEERLLHVLDNTVKMNLSSMLLHVKNEIDAFADGTEQFDDITMLALEIK